MLSICIPIYNQNVSVLVSALNAQINKLSEAAEIILIDDCSEERYKQENKDIAHHYQYIELKRNIGRAKIRNLFLNYVHYDYLLFLDCDATITSINLLQQYVDTIKANHYQVYCGGSVYPKEKPPREYRLRWKNGNTRETISAEIRNKHPYSSFMTSNVLIKKEVFDHIQFDETIVKYGHEDTLFGLQLRKNKIPIYHINNSVLNDDLDSNITFLNKTEDALVNLANITQSLNNNKDLIEGIKILQFYFFCKQYKLLLVLNFVFNVTQRPIKWALCNIYQNLYLFDFYKLGSLSKAFKK